MNRAFWNPGKDSIPKRCPSRQKARPAGEQTLDAMAVCQPKTLGGESVKIRRDRIRSTTFKLP